MALEPYFTASDCDPVAFEHLIAAGRTLSDSVAHAHAVQDNIPIYCADGLTATLNTLSHRKRLMAEWNRVLQSGPGVFVIKGAQGDHEAIDAASEIFHSIIADEAANKDGGADHFAARGRNARIWNSLQKLCLASPETHMRYFSAPAIDAACEAWLGPHYQMTAQINLVRPGGGAQEVHRDYHLGFQTNQSCERYPAPVHDLSPYLTLQGGIAHADMPIENGPTKLLPFSQLYRQGYLAWRQEAFREIFERHHVQLHLAKGDALFFNPALFHAAGENRSADMDRMVNLLQVSSPFARSMESVDRAAMCRAVFPALIKRKIEPSCLGAVIAATAEGYPFPTNLDSDPPTDGLAPMSQQDLLRSAVDENWSIETFNQALEAMEGRRRP